MPSRKGVDVTVLLKVAKKIGMLNQGLVAQLTGRFGVSAYYIFRQLRDLCESGYLDDDSFVCVPNGDRILFRAKGDSKGGEE